MARIVAIANQKGGVGKTTTAVNVSACMAQMGKKVLLIDMDAQCNASSGLGFQTEALEYTTYQLFIDEYPAQDMILPTPLENLKMIPSHIDLAGAEIELASKPEREYVLKKMLQPLSEQFDYIFLDCPPSFGLITLNALTAAQYVIIPLQCEYYALEGLSRLQNTIELVKANTNPSLFIGGIVFTQFNGRTNLSIQVVDEVKKYFPQIIYRTLIPRNVRLSEAPSHGLPVNLYDAKSKGAIAYRELAEEVLARDESR